MIVAVWSLSPVASMAQDRATTWLTPPVASADDAPELAKLLGIDGRVVVECQSSEHGLPEACQVRSESPGGLGFGEHAIEIAQRGRLNPALRDGQPVRSRFRIAIPFYIHKVRQPPAVWTGPAPSPQAMETAERVAERVLAVSPAPFMQDIDAPADRRELVQSWFRQEMPSAAETRRILATVLARNLSLADLQAMEEGGPSAVKAAPTEEQFEKSARDLFDFEAMAAKVRARYCARFECEIRP